MSAYDLLAELLEYPRGGTLEVATQCRDELRSRGPAVTAAMDAFLASISSLDDRALEELYTRTFDLNPPATLDLGFQLFGESYKRGIFLVKMQRAVASHGIDRGSELGDHLPLILRLLARLAPDEDPRGLVDDIVLPTMAKILGTFVAENPYRTLLEATAAVLKLDFAIETVRELPREIEMPFDDRRNDGKRRLDLVDQRSHTPGAAGR